VWKFSHMPSQSSISERHDILRTLLREFYHDRLFPSEFDLKSRLRLWEKERGLLNLPSFDDVLDAARMAPKQFVIGTDHMSVDQRPKSVMLVEEPHDFEGWVDPTDAHDPYSQEFWRSFETVMASLEVTGRVAFAGGRYGMASQLRRLCLPLFTGCKLGEICHIVHLAIRRRLVAYNGSMLIAGNMHEACQNASAGVPTLAKRFAGRVRHDQGKTTHTNSTDNKAYVQSECELSNIVLALLMSDAEGLGLDISKLKGKIMERYNLVLSETMFGCTKLLELLETSSLNIVCVVKSIGNKHRVHLKDPDVRHTLPSSPPSPAMVSGKPPDLGSPPTMQASVIRPPFRCATQFLTEQPHSDKSRMHPVKDVVEQELLPGFRPPPGLEHMVPNSTRRIHQSASGLGAQDTSTSLRASLRSLGTHALQSLGHEMRSCQANAYSVQAEKTDSETGSTRCSSRFSSLGSQDACDVESSQRSSSVASSFSADELLPKRLPTLLGSSGGRRILNLSKEMLGPPLDKMKPAYVPVSSCSWLA